MTITEPVVLEDYKHNASGAQLSSPTNTDLSIPPQDLSSFPREFICPELGTVMKDPVLGPDGISYEKSAVVPESPGEDNETPKYYPNRALAAIIQEELSLRHNSVRASLRYLQNSVSQSISQILPESTSNEPYLRPLNDAYYCPITFNLMHQPVTDPEGNTFEKVAVENWIRANGNSPITRTELNASQLYPNNAIHTLLQNEKDKPLDEMHPSIRKWRDEAPPQSTDIEMGGALPTPGGTTNTNNSGTANYPLSVQQWEQRELERRRWVYRNIGLALAGASITGFVYFGESFFLLMFLMSIMFILANKSSRVRF